MASASSATTNASAANAAADSNAAQGQAQAPQGSPAVALNPAQGGGNKVTPPYASGSLYVGDLNPDVTEALLFDTFNAVGPVASVRVCRDAATRRSLGYAYVNFINLLDAERALDTMNFSPIKGRACRIMWSHRDPSLRKSGVGNIFVKNLAKSIDNKALFDTFSVFGNILSCKVAVNTKRESLGYGFVQFAEQDAAQTAIEQVNGMSIAGEKVSVQSFKSKKERSGGADSKKQYTNVYVKNLPLDFSKKKLDDLFSPFGKITSSTLMMFTPEEYKEKLEKDEARAKAIAEKKKAAEDKAKADAAAAASAAASSGAEKDKEKAAAAPGAAADAKDKPASSASPSAAPTAAAAAPDAKAETKDSKTAPGDKCKGFGFVNFETADQAQAAVNGLNGKELIPGKKLFVSRAQKKEERERELRDKFDAFKAERQKKYAGVNLYVKNLADSVDEKKIQSEFARFGAITSLKIMTDDKTKKSRGFGFVCFSSPDEATKAVTEMNGRMVDGKPLYVALAQRKEVRRAQLEQQHSQRQRQPNMANVPFPGPFGMYQTPGQFQAAPRGFFPGAGPQGVVRGYRGGPQPSQGQAFGGNPQAVVYGGVPVQGGPPVPMGYARGQPLMPGAMGMQQMQYQMSPVGMMGGGRAGPMGNGQPRGGRGGAARGGPQRGGPARLGVQHHPGMPGGPGGRGARAQPMAMAQPMAAPPQSGPKPKPEVAAVAAVDAMPSPAEPLTSSQLAAAPEEQRKQLLGERLFPLIQQHQPKLAGKITGMLLEMDNGELLHLLESGPALREKIEEAIIVLRESENEEAAAAAAAAGGPDAGQQP